ncbi:MULTISPECIES: hypothetical protein [unclassified Chryseobacterium]|uniref:hypothetical protein n=1 Tax=unclassified Chryseobacterium TaxID=2593645 RepID=UPI000B14D211|nr:MULTISPECIES: hypothetical protein [unclassified Chryseobacterium]
MFSILFLTLFLVSTTELYQLFKIPQLIEHYFEHKNLNSEMSFTAFLKTHYDHPSKDGDFGKDRKLPFIVHAKTLSLLFVLDKEFQMVAKQVSFENMKSYQMPLIDEDLCLKGFLNGAWEPPRISFS